MDVGFKWLLPGLRSSSASVQYARGYCCGRTDRRTAMLPAQTGVFSPTLRGAKAPGLLGFRSVALQEHPLQEHPTGASLSVAMEMRLRRSPGAVPLWGGLWDPHPTAALTPLGCPRR